MSDLLADLSALAEPRFGWTRDEVRAINDAPFNDLIFAAQSRHRRVREPNTGLEPDAPDAARRAGAPIHAARS